MYEITCPICNRTRILKNNPKSKICRSCAKKQSQPVYSPKVCEFCGKIFVPNSNHQRYCKNQHIRICPVCGKGYIEDNVDNLKNPPVACSYECRKQRTRETSMLRYGCLTPGNTPSARQKSKNTMLKRYGVEFAMQSPEIRQKARESLIAKFGVDNAGKCPEIIQQRLETNFERYGNYTGKLPGCRSNTNLRFENELKSRNLTFESEFKLQTKIYDFRLCNTLIEIDPTISHSSIDNPVYCKVDKYYHRDKTELAESNGYKCIHIWDWDNQSIILKQLESLIEINVSDLRLYKLTTQATTRFLQENCIHGSCRQQLLCLGLIKDDEIYQVMTFGKSKYDHSYDTCMMRACTKLGYSIIDGYNTISRIASRDFGVNNCITYVDRSKHVDYNCEELGMKLKRITQPQKIWSKGNKKVTANLLRARGFDQLFDTNYGKGASNEELMLQHGWLPVYDCGQRVYVFE